MKTSEQRPKRIGLTGNIGSGKSTAAQLLVKKGAALIDSDALAREATQDPDVLYKISEELGSDLVEDGQLNRSKTAERVFGDEAALQTLNGIIHPWVRRESMRRAEELSGQADPPGVILFDIPLLYENGLERNLDAVIVINTPLVKRIERVKSRSNLSEADVRARDAAQMPLEKKLRRADFVLDNSGSEDSLTAQVDALWPKLRD